MDIKDQIDAAYTRGLTEGLRRAASARSAALREAAEIVLSAKTSDLNEIVNAIRARASGITR
jgi:hypothetical protein